MNLTPTIFLLLFTLSVSAQKTTKPTPIVAVTKLASNADSVQYALGACVAQWINNNGLLITNPNLFLTGMDDQFKNKPHLLNDSVIIKLVLNYQNSSIKEKGIKQEQQMFASLKDKPGMGILPNGVRYIIITAGKGLHASEGDSLVLNLSAKLPDNTLIEDTYQSKKPFTASTNSFFPGLNEALLMMPQGSRWQLFIPANLAYGKKGNTRIPPNSALILEVDILSIKLAKK